MDFSGKIKDISKDFRTGLFNITFTVNETHLIDFFNGLLDAEILKITVDKFRKKRSPDANALLWHCIGEIAASTKSDKWDVYLTLLKRYGKFTYICVKPHVVESVKKQWRETEVLGDIEINGETATQLLCYFGSHTYDTKEFSRLLDGTISEMVECGIAPPTSEEMKRSLEKWENRKIQ